MSSRPGARGALVVVGTGIRLIGHTTHDALAVIRHADRVFHLTGDPASAAWIERENPRSTSLHDCYAEGRHRADSYADMVRRILAPVREGLKVCAVFYGHPGVGCDPGHIAIRLAHAEGYRAEMLPGVSSDGCLYADLGIDPFKTGVVQCEAWAFMGARPAVDPSFVLILWQVGIVGESSIRFDQRVNRRALRSLVAVLRRTYPEEHEVIVYEASPYPVGAARIERMPLKALATATLRRASTLCVPPIGGFHRYELPAETRAAPTRRASAASHRRPRRAPRKRARR